MLIFAIVFITLALVFYTIGVWGEKLQKHLKKWHLAFFGLGLICDTTGTYLMGEIAKLNTTATDLLHFLTGAAALILMAIHFIWAIIVLKQNKPKALENFHTFSLWVWLIWLIPYGSGVVMNAF